ncbi:hypothetical protein ACSAZK_00480 [Methanosarcina sp. Mfa9]|uniref:hypothetical protein n=1 Tax=Methanosarcina sp. Mfa9 TaxID=3439063 RepID=UPI003F87D908
MEKKESASDKLKRRLMEPKTCSKTTGARAGSVSEVKGSGTGQDAGPGAGYDRELISRAIDAALKNPRIGAWSPRSAMILNYIKFTRPLGGTSLSSEIDEILTRGLISRYPELHKAIEEFMGEKQIEIPGKKGKK